MNTITLLNIYYSVYYTVSLYYFLPQLGSCAIYFRGSMNIYTIDSLIAQANINSDELGSPSLALTYIDDIYFLTESPNTLYALGFS